MTPDLERAQRLEAARQAVIEAARRVVAMDNYCTVAESGLRAGPINYLRDALDAVRALEKLEAERGT